MSKVGQNVCDTLVYSSINNLEYTDLYSLQSFDVILINHLFILSESFRVWNDKKARFQQMTLCWDP